jgi:hypothetical protein
MTTNKLIPNYLNMDFETTKAHLIELLQANPVFANYRTDSEGNNITILIELIAYLNQLTTYYMNMIAKNQFISTADLYETVHSLAKNVGYNPQGYRSSSATVSVTISADCSESGIFDYTIPSGGTGYSINNLLTVEPISGGGTIRVLTVNSSGTILTSELVSAGSGYTVDNGLSASVSPSGGSGCLINITKITNWDGESLSEGDVLIIPSWKKMFCTNLTNPRSEETLEFVNMIDETTTITATGASASTTISLSAREGYITALTYHGSDIESDYRLYLPMETYDYGDDIDYGVPCISVYIAGVPWTRLSDFYESSTSLTENLNVYMLNIDKYKRYYLEFSSLRNIPRNQDEILVGLLRSSGLEGNVPSASINKPETKFVYNVTQDRWLNNTYISINNPNPSVGGANLETIDEIKDSAIGTFHSQYRNVCRADYISYLESRADIVKATIWGEQDIEELTGISSTSEYNKLYISLIPSVWGSTTISVSSASYDSDIKIPLAYSHDWKQTIMRYLEPRKIITTYEIFELPELLYFSFTVGLKVRSNYDYSAVEAAVHQKLQYYMSSINRNFHDIISYTDITDYMMDTTIEFDSTDDVYNKIKGLQTFTMRDIVCSQSIKEYGLNQYPYYMTLPKEDYDNRIRRIQLGYNQFPMLNDIESVREY